MNIRHQTEDKYIFIILHYFGHFWNMLLCGDSRANWVPFTKRPSQEIKIFIMNEWRLPSFWFGFWGAAGIGQFVRACSALGGCRERQMWWPLRAIFSDVKSTGELLQWWVFRILSHKLAQRSNNILQDIWLKKYLSEFLIICQMLKS